MRAYARQFEGRNAAWSMRIWAAPSSSKGWRGPDRGRSGGYRVLIAYRAKTRSVFLFGFAKSERGNVEDDELATLRDIAKGWPKADARALAGALAEGLIQEIEYDNEEEA
jgi:hypothetical protein